MSQLSGSFTVEIETARLGREIASHIIDAFNASGFADALGEYVAQQVAAQQVAVQQDPDEDTEQS